MAASNTDLFKKAKRKFSTTVGAGGFAQGATTLPLTTTTGLDTDTAITLMLDPGGATEEVITGVVSGSDIINCVRGKEGTTDQDHSAGDAVSMYFTETHWDDAMTGILQDHDQSGQHKNLTDANGNEWIKQTATSSAVNEITVANAATGNGPTISSTGGDTNINLNIDGKGSGVVVTDGLPPKTFVDEATIDYVASGCVWSGDSYGSTRAASMTAGVVYIDGVRLTVSAVTARSFTASKDTYVDLSDSGNGTATITYTEVSNNAASPALASGNIRIAIIVTGASSIANVGSVNQGQQDKVLPIASSVAYSVSDSLGNMICNRSMSPGLIGWRQSTSSFTTTSTSDVIVTGLSCPVIVPTGRKVRVVMSTRAFYNENGTNSAVMALWDGTVGSGTQISESITGYSGSYTYCPAISQAVTTPAAASKTYNASLSVGSAGTAHMDATSVAPNFIMVELV